MNNKNKSKSIQKVLISSALVGAVIGGGASAFASTSNPTDYTAPTSSSYTLNAEDVFRDEVALVSNLKMATKVLDAAIQNGQIDTAIYDKVMKSLTTIDAKVLADGGFKSLDTLLPVLESTDTALRTEVDGSADVLSKRADSIKALTSLQERLGLEVSSSVATMKSSGNVQIASASATSQYKTANVSIDGKIQKFEQSAILKDGNTLVPLRGVFEAFKG